MTGPVTDAAPRRDAQRPVAVLDIDGVVADVRHRLHHLARRPKAWEAFFTAAADDPALPPGVSLARSLAHDHDLVWLTGRPERNRRLTEEWLEAQGLPIRPLLMRADRDRRAARFAKLEQLRRLAADRDIALVVDDDPAVVDAVRAVGLPVRLADWVPYREPLRRAQHEEGRT